MNRKGFTLLELIMAMSFASVIIVGLVQAMRSSATFLATGRKYMLLDRKVALLFNQLEKDLSCAFIPRLHKDANGGKEKDKKEATDKKETVHFTATAQEDAVKIKGTKRYGLKDAAWVTTNVLSFGRKEPRLARVGYSLKKEALTRKETGELDNVKFEEPEDKGKKRLVREVVVCDGVKSLYIEFVVPRKKDEKAKEEPQPLRTYVWGETDETKNAVPQHAHVYLELWDAEHKHAFAYETMIAIAAFTKPKEVPKPQEGAQEEEQKEEKTEPKKLQAPKQGNPKPAAPPSNDISGLFNSLLGGKQ